MNASTQVLLLQSGNNDSSHAASPFLGTTEPSHTGIVCGDTSCSPASNNIRPKNPSETQAALAGRLGGLSRSERKVAASRLNGPKGGRPRKYERNTVPSFAYPGGKARMASALIAMMPPEGKRYVEPFGGRGNVFFAAADKLHYAEWQLNDLMTAQFFEAIRLYGHDFVVPPRTRSQYYLRWADYKEKNCLYAMLLEPYLTFGGAGYGMGGFCNLLHGGVSRSGYQQSLRMAHNILRATNPLITAKDYREVLATLGADDYAYLDPPYIGAAIFGLTAATP